MTDPFAPPPGGSSRIYFLKGRNCRHGLNRAICDDPECVVADVLEEPHEAPVRLMFRATCLKDKSSGRT